MRRGLGASLLVAVLALTCRAEAEEPPRPPAADATGGGPTLWLVASGGVVFGASYLISFGMAAAGQGCGNAFLGMDCVPRNAVPGSDWPLFIPIVGPFVALGTSKDRPAYALAILGAGQVVGAALFASGLAVRTPFKSGADLALSPSFFEGGAGLRLSREF